MFIKSHHNYDSSLQSSVQSFVTQEDNNIKQLLSEHKYISIITRSLYNYIFAIFTSWIKIKLIYINDILSSYLTVAILDYYTGLSPKIIVFHRWYTFKLQVVFVFFEHRLLNLLLIWNGERTLLKTVYSQCLSQV